MNFLFVKLSNIVMSVITNPDQELLFNQLLWAEMILDIIDYALKSGGRSSLLYIFEDLIAFF